MSFLGLNNPFDNPNGFGSRISDSGVLSHLRWYDPALLLLSGGMWAHGIAGREAYEGNVGGVKDFINPQMPISNMDFKGMNGPKDAANVLAQRPYSPSMRMPQAQPNYTGLGFGSTPLSPIGGFGFNNSERLLQQLQAQRSAMYGGF